MTRSGTNRWLVAGLVFALPACGVYGGPAAVLPTDGAKVVYGASAGYRAYLNGNRSLVLGGGVSATPPEGEGHGARGWASGVLGYGSAPLPYASRLGVELGAGPAVGILPRDGGYPLAAGWSWTLALPYRISKSDAPWEIDDHVIWFHTLTPGVEVVQLVPVAKGRRHTFGTTVALSLTYRFDSWFAVMP